ncbi:alpha,alpha-trehalase [Opitutaceae bacterium TAV5]|nr:alpha,alpha-trehalase [Opitutaceae bacterium TAV5]
MQLTIDEPSATTVIPPAPHLSTTPASARLERFIATEWECTLRIPAATPTDPATLGLASLPRPFVVPCADEGFRSFFYWDSCYASIGLLLQGRIREVVDVAENMRWLVNRLGYVPNQYEAGQLFRSQPPHYALVVSMLVSAAPGALSPDGLAAHLEALTAEYAFWSTLRAAPDLRYRGLNRYGHHAHPEELAAFGEMIAGRVPPWPDDPQARLVAIAHHLAEAESGWDFTTRFGGRCMDHLPVDLNALLFAHETVCADLARRTGDEAAAALWTTRAVSRREHMNAVLWCPEAGAFVDRDMAGDRLSPALTAASFYPLWAGVATPAQAVATAGRLLAALETGHALRTTCPASGDAPGLQWDSPNAWPPLQAAAVLGLLRYGLEADACRLARKWARTGERVFERTGKLWEKYNALTGDIDVRDEYPMPSMMGWSAGAWLLCHRVASGDIDAATSFFPSALVD